ncbi:MAG TPA: hypothetical protein VEP68_08795, partial [Anaeromyxobacteraceae bacterium]|nr:hypothetical protein [Anaeromyxobacteraceae bacterium]
AAPPPAASARATTPTKPASPEAGELSRLRRLEAQYAPVELKVDLSALPEGERRALAKLVEASRIVDALFLRQVWSGNEALLLRLAADDTPLGRARLAFFLRNKGPWDRLDHDRPFLSGVPEKPAAGNFYPAAATKAEVRAWMDGLPQAERGLAAGFFSVVRRGPSGLAAVPYSREYQPELAEMARLLREAAGLTGDRTLAAYLGSRAEALLSDDYYRSDVAWMELDSAVEPTIGPYETYEDGWFSMKAAFEAFVCLRDDAETRKVARLSGELQDIEDHLPIDDAWKRKLGALAPIRVVNQIFAAGDAARAVTTAAFNLPNDERVVAEKGSKRVMLKNVQEAKFRKVLLPMARLALSPADRAQVSFDAFFTHILMHELVHGLGPHRVAGADRPVREALEETYGALEEAKADVAGLFALQRLVDRGVLPREMERTMYLTFLASAFRTLRFGITEAHGKGMALQMSWLLDHGAFVERPDGTFGVDQARVKGAVADLAREIMTVQAKGDREAARAWLARDGVIRPGVQRVIDRSRQVPVDIAPRFVTAEALAGR